MHLFFLEATERRPHRIALQVITHLQTARHRFGHPRHIGTLRPHFALQRLRQGNVRTPGVSANPALLQSRLPVGRTQRRHRPGSANRLGHSRFDLVEFFIQRSGQAIEQGTLWAEAGRRLRRTMNRRRQRVMRQRQVINQRHLRRFTVGIYLRPGSHLPDHQLFGLPLKLAFHRAARLHRRLKPALCLGVGQIHISRVEFRRNPLWLGIKLANRSRHPHYPANKLHRKINIIHRLGRRQHESPWRIEAGTGRLLENQHLFRRVVGNCRHQHRVRVIRRMLADQAGMHLAQIHQILLGLLHRFVAIRHLHEQQRRQRHAGLLQLAFQLAMPLPRLTQHRAFQVSHRLHALPQVVHHRLDITLVQARRYHLITARRKALESAHARFTQKGEQALILRRCRRHDQKVRRQPMDKLAELGRLIQPDMRLINHHAQRQPLRFGPGDKGRQRPHFIVTIGVVTGFAILRPANPGCGRQQNHARFRFLIPPLRQHRRGQSGAVGGQRILRLLHQIDERHKPQPQRRTGGIHFFQHARNHVGLARTGRGAQQAGRRRLAQQGGSHVLDQRALKSLRLDSGRLGSNNVQRTHAFSPLRAASSQARSRSSSIRNSSSLGRIRLYWLANSCGLLASCEYFATAALRSEQRIRPIVGLSPSPRICSSTSRTYISICPTS